MGDNNDSAQKTRDNFWLKTLNGYSAEEKMRFVEEAYISESIVHRIHKRLDMVTSPLFEIVTAGDEFEHYYIPCELDQTLGSLIDYYDHQCYHESINNLTSADVYFGTAETILGRRKEIKRCTLRDRRRLHFHKMIISM